MVPEFLERLARLKRSMAPKEHGISVSLIYHIEARPSWEAKLHSGVTSGLKETAEEALQGLDGVLKETLRDRRADLVAEIEALDKLLGEPSKDS